MIDLTLHPISYGIFKFNLLLGGSEDRTLQNLPQHIPITLKFSTGNKSGNLSQHAKFRIPSVSISGDMTSQISRFSRGNASLQSNIYHLENRPNIKENKILCLETFFMP